MDAVFIHKVDQVRAEPLGDDSVYLEVAGKTCDGQNALAVLTVTGREALTIAKAIAGALPSDFEDEDADPNDGTDEVAVCAECGEALADGETHICTLCELAAEEDG
jgi:hypothetical protein